MAQERQEWEEQAEKVGLTSEEAHDARNAYEMLFGIARGGVSWEHFLTALLKRRVKGQSDLP